MIEQIKKGFEKASNDNVYMLVLGIVVLLVVINYFLNTTFLTILTLVMFCIAFGVLVKHIIKKED
ncbi:putative membrane protein [Erysipelothrix amsterdamensis]|uniref:Membrane protein n=1 Tax=Erysipelothrix amsterdamensis TaxID=2929157 RepID=A0AAU9VHV8_9FIRM|nr:putative membrane protein [Erysipelothrix sp. A18Y020d]CAH2763937.1 putative membrane protein [Erysipelothrix sp. A18Y020d]